MIVVHCFQCGHEMQAGEEHAGETGKCPNCGEVVKVPEPTHAGLQRSATTARVEKRLLLVCCSGFLIVLSVMGWFVFFVVIDRDSAPLSREYSALDKLVMDGMQQSYRQVDLSRISQIHSWKFHVEPSSAILHAKLDPETRQEDIGRVALDVLNELLTKLSHDETHWSFYVRLYYADEAYQEEDQDRLAGTAFMVPFFDEPKVKVTSPYHLLSLESSGIYRPIVTAHVLVDPTGRTKEQIIKIMRQSMNEEVKPRQPNGEPRVETGSVIVYASYAKFEERESDDWPQYATGVYRSDWDDNKEKGTSQNTSFVVNPWPPE